jgi:hypothetical protein
MRIRRLLGGSSRRSSPGNVPRIARLDAYRLACAPTLWLAGDLLSTFIHLIKAGRPADYHISADR